MGGGDGLPPIFKTNNMASTLVFNAGSNSLMAIPSSRLLSMHQTGATTVVLTFENKDGKAGQVTSVTLTTSNPAATMAAISKASRSAVSTVIADSVAGAYIDEYITAVTVDNEASTASGLVAGSGITGGTGTVYNSWIERLGSGLVKTTIYIDLTGLQVDAAGDVIGASGEANCHLGKIEAGKNGTIVYGRMRCLELPAGGDVDIDLFVSTDATLSESDDASAATGYAALLDAGASSLGSEDDIPTANLPADGEYIYMEGGAGAATFDTYTAGILLIEFYGTL